MAFAQMMFAQRTRCALCNAWGCGADIDRANEGAASMSYGFEPGRIYNRRSDIHARFGGQQQGGIITPSQHSLVIIITGEEGLEHGYADRYRADGVFEYFGEGQVGDMRLRAGNRAIAEHSAHGKALLLFRRTPEGLRFEGEMVCEGYHLERARDRTDAERQAIVFELRSLEAVAEKVEAEPAVPSALILEDLRRFSHRTFAGAITRHTERLPAESRCSGICLGARQWEMRGLQCPCSISAIRRHTLSRATSFAPPKRWRTRSSGTCDCSVP